MSAVPTSWDRPLYGGLQLRAAQVDFANSPVWNVITDKAVMRDHNDLGNPLLNALLRQLYHDLVVMPAETAHVDALR